MLNINDGVVAVHLRQAGSHYSHAIVDLGGVAISADGEQSEFSALVALDSAASIQYGALRVLGLAFEELDNAEDSHKVYKEFQEWVKSYAKPGDPICACNQSVVNTFISAKVGIGTVTPWNFVCNALDWAGVAELAPVVPIDTGLAVDTARILARSMARAFLGDVSHD